MKRKIFSKLLMVALVIASVSAFVSCKDYDDDINNLQKQIDAKAAIAQIESLQSQLTKAQSDATAAATAAANALKEAQAKTTDAAVKTAIDAAIEKVNKAAEEAATKNAEAIQKAADAAKAAGDDAAAAKTAADEAKTAAQKAYDDALAAIKAEIAKINIPDVSGFLTEAQVKALITQNAQAKGEYVTATSLATQLEDLKKTIPGAVDLTEINNAIASYSGAISELYSAITSVSLFGNVHEGNLNSATNNFDHLLNFLYVIEKENVFAKDVKFGGTNTADQKVADKQYTFTEGYYRTFADSIMIRVSPVNAKFTKDDLVLINSKGEDIVKSGLIEEVTVEPYTRLYALTRANAEQTGLYVVKFKLKDQFNENEAAQFKAAALLRENGRDLKVAYAIGIKNTKTPENGEDRYVVSEYDLTMQTALAGHAWNFNVNDVSVANIHNRYIRDDVSNNNNTEGITELTWLDINEPATTVILSGANQNATDRAGHTAGSGWNGTDNRQNQQILSVIKGEPITIEFINPIKGFYVTLDNAFATESKPSELNAWAGYTYEGGVGYWKINGKDTTVVAATMHDGNVATIAVKDMGNVVGDIIGFRVYAVNLDGTLVDPDGRAFYVKVGDPIDKTQSINKAKAVAIKVKEQFKGESDAVSTTDVEFNNTVTNWSLVWAENNPDLWNGNGTATTSYWYSPIAETQTAYYRGNIQWFDPQNLFNVTFVDGDGTEYAVNTLENATSADIKVASVKVALNNGYMGALSMLDGETYKLYLKGERTVGNVTEVIQYIALNITKVLPTAIPDVKVKAGQGNGNLTFTMKPYLHTLTGSNNNWTYSRSNYYENGTQKFLTGYENWWTNVNASNAWDVRFAGVARYGIDFEVKNFADIYSLINPETGTYNNGNIDQNYYFEFAEAGLQDDNIKKVIDAEVTHMNNGTYNWAGFTDNTFGANPNHSSGLDIAYCLPKIQKGLITVAGVKKNMKIGYEYRDISLTRNENLLAITNNVKVAAANKFEYTYKSAFDLTKIKDNNATAVEKDMAYATGHTITIDNITYKEAATAPDNWFELPADGATLAELVADHYVEIVPGSAKFTGLTDYFAFDTTYGTNGFNYTTCTAKFLSIQDTQNHNIGADVKGTLTVDIRDVWGNVQTVGVKLKMPKP